MADVDTSRMVCHHCGSVGFDDGGDGFWYCRLCNSQADDIMDTGVADEDFIDKTGGGGGGGLYMYSNRRSQPTPAPVKIEPISQASLYESLSQAYLDERYISKPKLETEIEDDLPDWKGPTEPRDFGLAGWRKGDKPAFEDYYEHVRMKYVGGIQLMIQYQCEALVKKFKVCPLICGFSGAIWLRYLASLKVFSDDWADEVMLDSESQGDKKRQRKSQFKDEPYNMYDHRLVIAWCRSLRKKIPLYTSLAVSYLACHIAREAIIPTDIIRWTSEGKLPYVNAFVDLQKHLGPPSKACPLNARSMFRPRYSVPLKKLESMAASIADSIGLTLPPVNFCAIASRYLKQLDLPAEKILPYACRICEWSMPPDLWLSASELRLPTRVCVMSILIVAIRILFNINGFGKWEKSIASSMTDQEGQANFFCNSEMDNADKQEITPDDFDDSDGEMFYKFESDAPKLLQHLERRYHHMNDDYDYMKDLRTYLQHLGDVDFAGTDLAIQEEKMKNHIRFCHQNKQEDIEASDSESLGDCGIASPQKRSTNSDIDVSTPSNASRRVGDGGTPSCSSANDKIPDGDAGLGRTSSGDDDPQDPSDELTSTSVNDNENLKDLTIRLLKLDMEENRFYYIPPRVNVKRHDYLQYTRKRDRGCLTYVAHADYYILLRACAKAVKVDVRILHSGVMRLESRLAWIEKRIEHCLQKRSKATCEFCTDVRSEDETVDFVNLSTPYS